jgi:hypothetical protein
MNPREEVLRLLEQNYHTRKIELLLDKPMEGEEWRDIPYLINRLLTVVPIEQDSLINDLRDYSQLVSTVAPLMRKVVYTNQEALQIMRMHIIAIAEVYHIPILNTRPWAIDNPWQRDLVKVFHNHI